MLGENRIRQLAAENRRFAGTGGVSEHNAQACFVPAFMDLVTQKVALSRYPDGRLAPFHRLDGLPEEWITKRDFKGRVVEVSSAVVSGFVRLGQFFSRQEAADYIESAWHKGDNT